MCERLKDLIPRHQFQIPIQAAIGGKVIARETISGYRKDVISRIHGGGARDRKKKLLEKQKKGKARMRQFGSVDIPQEAFIEVLKINKNDWNYILFIIKFSNLLRGTTISPEYEVTFLVLINE